MSRQQQIPYGIADFSRIRKQGMTYIDKTPFIAALEEAGNYLFFLRPRRSGKSLMVSTLAAYSDRLFEDDFAAWFGGTWIATNPTPERCSSLRFRSGQAA